MFTCVTYEFYSKLGCVYFFTNNNFAQTTVFDFFSSNGGDNSSGRGVFSKISQSSKKLPSFNMSKYQFCLILLKWDPNIDEILF